MRNPAVSILLLCIFIRLTFAQVTIQIDASLERWPISPYIYGKNNTLSDNASKPTAATEISRCLDAGVTIHRLNGGNNATKYNWRAKISSHPNWYNNVYSHDWGYAAKTVIDRLLISMIGPTINRNGRSPPTATGLVAAVRA
jgi:hypothetical protein